MTLKQIEIENIKGIQKHSFYLDILPNRPSILVAPNGFGKTSFATAFGLLRPDGLQFTEYYNLHRYDTYNLPRLSIKYQKPDKTVIDLEASHNSNTIKNSFDYFVINSLIDAKGTGTNYGSELTIRSVCLVEEIPEKVKFSYSPKAQKKVFGINGKILPNIKNLLSSSIFINSISQSESVLDATLKDINQRKIAEFTSRINKKKVLQSLC